MKLVAVVAENHFMSDLFTCYNCKNQHEIGSLFCVRCNYIQPITRNDYFAVLNIKAEFWLDLEELEFNYLKLQQLIHPDKFVTKSKPEQILALKHSVLLNNAYETLKDNLSRSEYLLAQNKLFVNQGEGNNINPDLELLEEIMEFRTILADVEKLAEVKNLADLNNKNKQNTIDKIKKYFTLKNYENAARETIKLRYLDKITLDIELKLTMLTL